MLSATFCRLVAFFCTFDVLSVEEKCMGLECRRKGLEESCPLHVGRTGGRWIEMDWRTARPSGPQVGGIHISVLHHIVFLLSFLTLQCILHCTIL